MATLTRRSVLAGLGATALPGCALNVYAGPHTIEFWPSRLRVVEASDIRKDEPYIVTFGYKTALGGGPIEISSNNFISNRADWPKLSAGETASLSQDLGLVTVSGLRPLDICGFVALYLDRDATPDSTMRWLQIEVEAALRENLREHYVGQLKPPTQAWGDFLFVRAYDVAVDAIYRVHNVIDMAARRILLESFGNPDTLVGLNSFAYAFELPELNGGIARLTPQGAYLNAPSGDFRFGHIGEGMFTASLQNLSSNSGSRVGIYEADFEMRRLLR